MRAEHWPERALWILTVTPLTLSLGQSIWCVAKEGRMPKLLSIGRFAKQTGLTVRALRLYDRRGLLQPAVVDFRTSFRYYSPVQLTAAQHIRVLRSLELPLEEIAL